MGRKLVTGSKIRLSGIVEREFQIEGELGAGGSCVAYKVSFDEAGGIRHTGVLKEYCPAYLGLADIDRSEQAQLTIPEAYKDLFQQGVSDFSEAYKAISNYLAQHDEAANYHPVPLGLYYGNGTVYSLSSRDFGNSYDKVKDRDLKSVLRVLHSLSLAISQFHEAGYLHLDIKPENILILDGVTELVKLFDYDSLLPIEKLRKREELILPHPGIYYVPDLDDHNLRAIGPATDIFEIGVLLFLRLFGRAPKSYEMEDDAVYPWDNAPLAAGIPPQAKFELEQILRNTLQISVRKRFQSDALLIAQIEKTISLVQEHRPYPLNLPKWQPSAYHLGRESELRTMRTQLMRDGYVFLRGMGGIGKSELAKQYAKQYAGEYHTVQFCKYTDSLEVLAAAIPMQGIKDTDYDTLAVLSEEKRKILHQCDCHTLLIVDNFNVTYDPLLRDFLPSDGHHFHVILTTRCTPAPEYYEPMVMRICPLSMEDCLSLFQKHYRLPLDTAQEDDTKRLISRVERNTLLLELCAKAMRRAHLTPMEMLEKLESQETANIRPEIFFEYDYTNEETEAYNRLYGHLLTVYSISKLQRSEKDALKCLTLVPPSGMSLDLFSDGCSESPEIPEQVPILAALGWIEFDEDQRISMHQVVSDILANNPDLGAPDGFESLFETQLDACDISSEIHFTKAMEHLAAASHLNRRCKDVCADNRIACKLTLGILYLNLYQAKNARKLFSEAERLSVHNGNLHLPYILLQEGYAEAQFGRQEEATATFDQVIHTGQTDLEQYGDAVLEAMLQQAALLADNNENESALRKYDNAIAFAADHGMADMLSDAFSACEELCKELGDATLLKYYRQLAVAMTGTSQIPEENELGAQLAQGHVEEARREYARILESCRDSLGEDSPIYQDIGKWRWMLSALLGDREQTFWDLSSTTEFVEKYYGSESIELAELLSWVGRIMPELGELPFAMDASKRAVNILVAQRSTQKYAYTRAKLAIANIYLLLGQLSEAEQQIDTVSFDSYDGATFLDDLIRTAGPILCELSRYKEALALSRRALARSDASPVTIAFAQIISATCYEQQGDLSTATQIAEQISKDAIEDYDMYALKLAWLTMYDRLFSRLAYQNGDYEAAIRFLDDLLQEAEGENPIYLYRIYAERGLFQAKLGNAAGAEEDFLRAEAIMKQWKLPEDAYLLLYNNISILYTELIEPSLAKQYLDKIQKIDPQVIYPKTYLAALICHNIGWNAVLLGDYPLGEKLLNRAIHHMELLGLKEKDDFWNAKRNLGLLYDKMGQTWKAAQVYKELVAGLMHCAGGIQTSLRLHAVAEYASLLYQENAQAELDKLVSDAESWFSELYGNTSRRYIELLLYLVELAVSFGDGATAGRLLKTLQPVCSSADYRSTDYNARWQNDLGVYFCDIKNNYSAALTRFLDAARLLESLKETGTELYSIVQKNIQYAKQKL